MSEKDNTFLVDTISKAITLPGVKVNRNEFLVSRFGKANSERREKILEEGPVNAGYSQEELKRIAKRLVNERTLTSSGISFAAGIPGGVAMAGTIPADTIQFYGMALRLAQEIAYLYGAEDFWENGDVNLERVTGQLVIYCGVMFGVSGASATLKVMSSALSKQAMKKLPAKALTKTFYYPIVKQIAKVFGAKMTKDVFAKGVSKVIPVIGGFVSGGLTLASMRPMGMRLVYNFDEALFDYTEEDYKNDIEELNEFVKIDFEAIHDIDEESEDLEISIQEENKRAIENDNFTSKITAAKELLDQGLIDDDEFKTIKTKLIERL